MESASVTRWPRDDRRHRAWPDPGSYLSIQGVRREPSGQGPVQRRDEQVCDAHPWRGTGSLGRIELGHQPPPLSHTGGSREEWLAGLARGALPAEGSFLAFAVLWLCRHKPFPTAQPSVYVRLRACGVSMPFVYLTASKVGAGAPVLTDEH